MKRDDINVVILTIFVCILILSFFLLPVPLPSPVKSGQAQQNQVEREEQKSSDNNPGATIVTTPQANNQSYANSQDTPSNRWIAFFTFVLAVVAFLQWWTSRTQAKLMRDGLTETKKAADAATKSAETAENALHLAERADVLVDAAGFLRGEDIPTGDSQFAIRYKNFGRTRAWDVVCDVNVRITNGPLEKTPPSKPAIIGAGKTGTTAFQRFRAWMPEQTFKQILSGEIELWFEGEIRYRDIFDKPHRTECRGKWDCKHHIFTVDMDYSG